MPGLVRPQATYSIRVRDGNTLKFVGELSAYRKALFVRRHNGVGSWAIEMDARDPVAGYLVAAKAGIQVIRQLRDPLTGKLLSSGVLFSGPRWGRVRQMKDNILTASGFDDNIWLQGRLAYTVNSYPYSTLMHATSGLLRYYRMNDASGTTLTDASTSSVNGTLSATGVTHGVTGALDDTDNAMTFDGVAGYATFGTSGLPTGNNPWTIGAWINVVAFPATGHTYVVSYGSETAGNNPLIYLDTSGTVNISGWSWGDMGSAVTVGQWYFVVGKWNGTTMSLYVNGQLISTVNQGAMTIPTIGTAGSLCANHAGTANFAHAQLDEPFICSGALSDQTILSMYNTGISRFGYAAYDTQTGPAETVIRHYVDVNAISAINDQQGQSRVVPTLTAVASSGRGNSVSANARFDQLVSSDGTGLLQQLGITGGMGFKIAQNGSALQFSQYVPTDRTASVIFSQSFGNLADFSYDEGGPDFTHGGNVILLGGLGVGTGRTFVSRTDTTSLGKWGRFEGFSDARDTNDVTTLNQRGDAVLAQMSASTKSSMKLAPQVGLVYGQDFDLGDKVTVVLEEGSDYSGPVQPLALSVLYNTTAASLSTAEQAEVNNVGIGGLNTPNSSPIGLATGWGEIWSHGNSNPWAGLGAMGTPTGRGMILDSTLLEGYRMAAGAYQVNVKVSVNVGTLVGDIYANFYKRSSAGVYTFLASSIAKGVTIQSNTGTLAADYSLSTVNANASDIFGVGDKLYCDLWVHVTTNSTGSGTAVMSWRAQANNTSQSGGDASTNNMNSWYTPGYQYYSPKPSPTIFQDLIREVSIELDTHAAETITPTVGTPGAEVVGSAFGAASQKQISQLRTTVARLVRSS